MLPLSRSFVSFVTSNTYLYLPVCRNCLIPTRSVSSVSSTLIQKQLHSPYLKGQRNEAEESVEEDAGGSTESDNPRRKAKENTHPYKSLFPWKSKLEFAEDLASRVVHDNDGLIVINKPFGVGIIHAPAKQKGMPHHSTHLRGTGTSEYSLEVGLPYLKKIWNEPNLVLVKSTEKMTSGIAVFARSRQHGEKFQENLRISKQLSHQTPLYNYLVLTVGFPFNNQTLIHERVGIALRSTQVSDLQQPVVEREFAKKAVKRGHVKPVHVRTNVLQRGNWNTCLLKVETSTIQRSFLRVYCADLLVPILGDHLYSCRVQKIMGVPAKIDIAHSTPGAADQKLSPDVLEALQVAESIEVPPHMHLLSYKLHNYRGKGNHLELRAPPPDHFQWTLDKLHIKHPLE